MVGGHHRFVAPPNPPTRVVVGLTALFSRRITHQKGRGLPIKRGGVYGKNGRTPITKMLRECDILPSVEVKTCVLEHMERKSCSFYGICFSSPSVCGNIKVYEEVTGKSASSHLPSWRGFIPPSRKFLYFAVRLQSASGGFCFYRKTTHSELELGSFSWCI